jgi:hypothetical protein
MNKQLLSLVFFGAICAAHAQAPQNFQTTGNNLSSTEYIGTNNNEDLVVKTNGTNHTIFKKNGNVRVISLQGTGNRPLYVNDNGVLSAYPLGQPGQILTAEGTWIDPPQNYWQINSNGNKIWTNKNRVGINMNSAPAFTLDVNGDGHFTGNLVLNGELIINEKITSPKQLITAKMVADSIIMDGGKAIYGETNIKGDVKLKYTLDVVGNSTFHGDQEISGQQHVNSNQYISGNQDVSGNFIARQGITFDGTNGIRYVPATPTSGAKYFLGENILPAGGVTCFPPNNSPWFVSQGMLISRVNTGQGSGSVNSSITMMSAPWNGSGYIEVEGVNENGTDENGLLLNFFCGRNTFINTNNGLPNGGGRVFMGERVSMARYVGIGYNTTGNIDETVALNIFANENNQTALKLTSWNGTVKAIDLVNVDGTSNFNVLQNGQITSRNLQGSGNRTLLVDDNGKLFAGPVSSSTNGSWNLGGNNISDETTEYIGTTNQKPFNIWAGNSPQISVRHDGKTIIGSSNLGSNDYAKLNVTDIAPTGIEIFADGLNSGLANKSQLRVQNGYGWVDLAQDEHGVGRLMWANSHILSFHGENLLIGEPSSNTDVGDINTKLTISTKTANGFTGFPLKIVNPDLTTPNKTIFEVLLDGTTHIGNKKPFNSPYINAKLSVDGTIVTKEVYVCDQVSAGWADYVFNPDYKLMPLAEIQEFVKNNKHLPNVPSAKEIAEQGQGLGKLQVVQMEKIEELYLHMIEMSEKLEKLEKENAELKKLILEK